MVSVMVVVTVPQVYANVQTQDADLKCERVSEHQLQLDKAQKCHNPNKYNVSFDWGVCVRALCEWGFSGKNACSGYRPFCLDCSSGRRNSTEDGFLRTS